MKHTFAIAAYGDSPYLEDAILSLVNQNLRTNVIICTSTPSAYIEKLAEKYGVRLFTRDGVSSLAADWNFAAETAVRETGAELVTVAHQDDIYEGNYTRALFKAFSRYPDMSLFCTDFRVIDSAGKPLTVSYESVKKTLRLPLKLKKLAHLRTVKRLPLIFGNPVCAPSCTYNTGITGLPLFREDKRFVPDWLTLLRLAGEPGRFICIERPLVAYRIHEDAETMKLTRSHEREEEEYEVFKMLHVRPLAYLLMRFYRLSYGAYGE